MNASLPTTRATTVGGYLNAIKKLALDEPKRIDMGIVCLRGDENIRHRTKAVPDCGTVGCVAGWSLTLAGLTHTHTSMVRLGDLAPAVRLLGLDERQAKELFLPDDLIDYNVKKQTHEHALMVVAHIEAFQATYPELMKRRVNVPAAKASLEARY